jgi:hypothetical protein
MSTDDGSQNQRHGAGELVAIDGMRSVATPRRADPSATLGA